MPAIVAKSISILSDAGLGMAMFSLGMCFSLKFLHYAFISSIFMFYNGIAGLFMALQPRIIACGKSIAAFSMGVRFLTGPAVMAAASIAVGLRGTLLHIAIVQVKS